MSSKYTFYIQKEIIELLLCTVTVRSNPDKVNACLFLKKSKFAFIKV